jgi:RNA polymerase sigma-70 factor (ECF subfamily)
VSYLDFLADDLSEPGSEMENEESRQRVREIVTRMPDNLREVLVLGYYQRFAYREIAEILSIPLGTVKSRLHAAVSYFAEAYRRDERRRTAREGHEAKKMQGR